MDFAHRPGTARPLQQRQAWARYEPVADPERLRRFFGVALPLDAAAQLTLAGMAADATLYEPALWLDEPAPLGYKLFFALFPEPEDAARLFTASTRVVSAHPLRAVRQPLDRLHMTLCSVHDSAQGVPHAVIDAAIAAASQIQTQALELRLDSAVSFKEDGAFMLQGDATTDAAVARLRRPMMAVLRRFGLKPVESSKPHMSLVYRCGRKIDRHGIDPLPWTAHRFALVLSHVGRTRHEWLRAWSLPGR